MNAHERDSSQITMAVDAATARGRPCRGVAISSERRSGRARKRCGPPPAGKRRPDQGGYPRDVGMDLDRATYTGLAVRGADIAEESGVHSAGGGVTRIGNRCKHRDLQLHERSDDAMAAGPRSRIAGVASVAYDGPEKYR